MNPLQDQLFKKAPNNWGVDRMKDVVSLRDKKTSERSEEVDYIELEDIESGSGRLLNKRNTLEVESAVTLFEKGDVLFGKLRPYLEKYFEADFNGKCTGEILAFQPKRIHSGFLRFCVASPWFIQLATVMAYGAKMPRANWTTQLAAFDVPLPPADEQRRIAAYLDASCRAIDAAVAAKREQISVLSEIFLNKRDQAVLLGLQSDSAPAAGPPAAPSNWRRTKLRYEISIRNGDFATDKLNDTGEYPVMGGNGQMGRSSDFNIDGEFLVVGRVGAHCGNAHYFNGRAWVSDNALIIESTHDKKFLANLILALDFNSTAKKTAQPLVTGTQIKNAYISVPGLTEQGQIVEFIECLYTDTMKLHDMLDQQIRTLISYRKSLIHECVTGQRRITDEDVNRVTAHAASLA